MSEKPPTNFDLSREATLGELQSLVDHGLNDNAIMIAKFKVEQLETAGEDVEKVLQGKTGEISTDDWEIIKADIEE